DGASVGFLPPLDAEEAGRYWDGVFAAVAGGGRRPPGAPAQHPRGLRPRAGDLGGRGGGRAPPPRHASDGAPPAPPPRGRPRRLRIGRALMLAADAEARRLGRTTLVLDTRQGDPSERLYRSLGWERAGVIPRYARSASGALDGSAFYYRLLESA